MATQAEERATVTAFVEWLGAQPDGGDAPPAWWDPEHRERAVERFMADRYPGALGHSDAALKGDVRGDEG